MSEFRTTNVAIEPNVARRPIVINAVKCLECGVILESLHRHDFRSCGCPNQTFVDGGLDYRRYGGVDMSKVIPLGVL